VTSVDELDGFTLSGDEDGGLALYCQVPPHEGGYNHGPIAQHDGPMRLGTILTQLADAARAHLAAEHPPAQGR
jgi:hypothetical protein